ncbi:MAG TPA: 16S rRNA (uracil(1498)-N(3))-methyltransferase [Rhizobiales bacterium]|nr:16S rRNA (uracil(1498)-N(3))-methyltransferase [Hyphomicrobiales bacterium]
MNRNLSRTPRLFVDTPLRDGEPTALSSDQAHYLSRVMRLAIADRVRVFNGDDGEWLAEIEQLSKRGCIIRMVEKLREPQKLPDVDYLFAPLKSARLDYLVQKATEMGAARLCPVLTEYTQLRRLKLPRLVANAIEAAEQCNIVAVPEVLESQKLDRLLDQWPDDRQLIFCDESAASTSPMKTLKTLAGRPVALLVGPEGGFSPRERERLLGLPFVTAISLGPRIMRADTAAVAALAVLQATIGDWN